MPHKNRKGFNKKKLREFSDRYYPINREFSDRYYPIKKSFWRRLWEVIKGVQ